MRIIVHTFSDSKLSSFANDYCKENNLAVIDALSGIINLLAERTGDEPLHKASINHNTDHAYFKRIEAIEFAVTYDDGKDPSGFLKADIVLFGRFENFQNPVVLVPRKPRL